MHTWLVADLDDDMKDEIIFTGMESPGFHCLLVSDSNMKIISQINTGYKIRHLQVLRHPKTKENWLFYAFNSGKEVYLRSALYEWGGILKREDFHYTPIARTDQYIDKEGLEWYGSIIPQKIDDLDGDGKYEVICITTDGYTSNPRGIIVYDLLEGFVKWQLDLPTVAANLHVEDFDGDGKKEILYANYAFKNNNKVMHGIDDANGYVLMIDANGKILTVHNTFSGFGCNVIQVMDIDQDGKPEIFKVESTWGSTLYRNSAEMMKWDGSRFISLKKYEIEANLVQSSVHFLVEVDKSGLWRIFLCSKTKGLMVLNEDFKEIPKKIREPVSYVYSKGDLTGHGKMEVLVHTDRDVFLLVDHEANLLAELPNPFPEEQQLNTQVIKYGFGKETLLAVFTPNQVNYYRLKRLPLWELFYATLYHYRITGNIIILTLLLLLVIALLRYRIFYRQIINQSNCGIIFLRNEQRILYVNDYCQRLFATAKKPRKLQDLSAEIHKLVLPFIKSSAWSFHSTLDLSVKDELLSFNLVLLRTKGIVYPYVLILNPIACVNKAVNDKMAWAELARRLSHHVRRHISNILLALQPIEDRLQANGESLPGLDVIKTEINNIKVFTHAFQRFTELKDYQLKAQDVLPSVERVLQKVHFPKNVKLTKDFGLGSIEAYIEPIRFEEAMTNLITNALDAMPEGGNLMVSLKEFPLHEVKDRGLSILIEIEDSGKGIPAKHLSEIWQPFFTTKQDGTGIGLPESKKIIESMQGNIEIQSEIGVGTIVSIWLKGVQNL